MLGKESQYRFPYNCQKYQLTHTLRWAFCFCVTQCQCKNVQTEDAKSSQLTVDDTTDDLGAQSPMRTTPLCKMSTSLALCCSVPELQCDVRWLEAVSGITWLSNSNCL